MLNLFDVIPRGFFNNLSSQARNRIWSDCLMIIYEEYDREVSYRLPRSRIQNTLARYLLENQVDWQDPEVDDPKNYMTIAGSIIRNLCSPDVRWLEEDSDENTFEKQIVMTEQGIMLAEFLLQLRQPEKDEYASYILGIYHIVTSQTIWETAPYEDGLRGIYRNAKALSKSLKKLSTFIRKIIERMASEESLKSLTDNIVEYCDGSFIREYSRLTRGQNIHLYRGDIRRKLEEIRDDLELEERMARSCAEIDHLSLEHAHLRIQEMMDSAQRFLFDDYDRIMADIRHKIYLYMQLALGRARFLQQRESSARSQVQQALRQLVSSVDESSICEEIPEDMQHLFNLHMYEYIDTRSIRFPRRFQMIRETEAVDVQEMTEEDLVRERQMQQREAHNPFSKQKMKLFLDLQMQGKDVLHTEDLPLSSQQDLLTSLSSVAYAQENGYAIVPEEGYVEADRILLRRFEVRRATKRST